MIGRTGTVSYEHEQENTATSSSPILETVHGIFLILQGPKTVLTMNRLVIF